MPWDETDAMKERVTFALEWERRWKATHGGRVDMAELCRMFGISPPAGYLWIARYRAAGHHVRALQERSRPGARASCVRGSRIVIPAAYGRARAASQIY
jgi:hypothetical protein